VGGGRCWRNKHPLQANNNLNMIKKPDPMIQHNRANYETLKNILDIDHFTVKCKRKLLPLQFKVTTEYWLP
jgi:hypothetical protein